MPTTIQLSNDERETKGKELTLLVESDIRDRYPHLKRREIIRNIYNGISMRQLRYEGQSDIHLPVLTEKVEMMVPKEMNAFWNADPHIHVERVGGEYNVDEVDNVQRYINWAVETDVPNFYATTEMWMRNRYVDGVSIVMPWYNQVFKRTVQIHAIKTILYAGETDVMGAIVPEPREKTIGEIIFEIFPSALTVKDDGGVEIEDEVLTTVQEKLTGRAFLVDFVEDRRKYEDVRVEFHPSDYVDEIQVYVYREVLDKDNVEVEAIEYEDFVVPYRTDDIQTAPRITRLYYLNYAEIQQKIKYEDWEISEEEAATLKKGGGSAEKTEEIPDNKGLKSQKDKAIGETGENAEPVPEIRPYHNGKYLILEVYTRDDLMDDGIFSEVIYHIPYGLKKIVKSEYLEERFPHGRRPFAVLKYIPISNRFYAVSLGDLLAPINVESNCIVNLVNDVQEIINNPFGFYNPTAFTTDSQPINGLEPGQMYPIGDINGVMFPKFSQEPLANLSALDSMLMFADRLTVSPQAAGSSQVRNAPRTARGTLALLSEAGIKVDAVIRAAQKEGWQELIHQIYALYSAFAPDEKEYYVTGEINPRKITNKELRGRYRFAFKGNSVNTNREVMRTIAQVRTSTLLSDPLYMQDMQARKNVIANFLQYWSEGANVDELLPRLPGEGGTHPPYDQMSEIRMLLDGHMVEPLPLDNHMEHMQVITKFKMGKEFNEMIDTWGAALIAAHYAGHARFAALQQMQGGAVQGAGTANNIPTGMTLAGGSDLEALEGGIQ